MHYRTLGKEKTTDLTCLCGGCHKKFHKQVRQTVAKKAAAKKRKKKRPTSGLSFRMNVGTVDTTSGKVRVFNKAEREEYERQMRHLGDI